MQDEVDITMHFYQLTRNQPIPERAPLVCDIKCIKFSFDLLPIPMSHKSPCYIPYSPFCPVITSREKNKDSVSLNTALPLDAAPEFALHLQLGI
jgi:hypothetical protein